MFCDRLSSGKAREASLLPSSSVQPRDAHHVRDGASVDVHSIGAGDNLLTKSQLLCHSAVVTF